MAGSRSRPNTNSQLSQSFSAPRNRLFVPLGLSRDLLIEPQQRGLQPSTLSIKIEIANRWIGRIGHQCQVAQRMLGAVSICDRSSHLLIDACATVGWNTPTIFQ